MDKIGFLLYFVYWSGVRGVLTKNENTMKQIIQSIDNGTTVLV